MKPPNAVRATPAAWLAEIAAAFLDAREAIPFGPLVGQPFGVGELFHLAPAKALKFRGIRSSDRALRRATETALASYVVNSESHERVLKQPHVSFAFCYLASHHGLNLLGELQADRLMAYVRAAPRITRAADQARYEA